jgi:hypothetical protein
VTFTSPPLDANSFSKSSRIRCSKSPHSIAARLVALPMFAMAGCSCWRL